MTIKPSLLEDQFIDMADSGNLLSMPGCVANPNRPTIIWQTI